MIRSVGSGITRGKIFWNVYAKDDFCSETCFVCVCVLECGTFVFNLPQAGDKNKAEPAGWWGLLWIYKQKLEDKRAIK